MTTIILDAHPGYEFEVITDADVSDPIEESGAPVELFKYAEPGVTYAEESRYVGKTTDLTGVFSRLLEDNDPEKALRVTRRWAEGRYGWTAEEAEAWISTMRVEGQYRGDWADVFVAVDNTGNPEKGETRGGYGTAQGWLDEWAMWYRGDVYGVTVFKVDEDGEHEVEDGMVWGVYADGPEEAARYIADELIQEPEEAPEAEAEAEVKEAPEVAESDIAGRIRRALGLADDVRVTPKLIAERLENMAKYHEEWLVDARAGAAAEAEADALKYVSQIHAELADALARAEKLEAEKATLMQAVRIFIQEGN